MASEGSITALLSGIQQGDPAALGALVPRCFPDLVRFARQQLREMRRGTADENDVALSALNSFCQAAVAGHFPDLADRHDLWRLLLTMTARKAEDTIRHEARQRFGGGRVGSESALDSDETVFDAPGLAQVGADISTSEFATMMSKEFVRLLALLGDEERQRIAVAKMEGCSNEEIAAQLRCSVRTVEFRLQLIRRKWKEAGTA